MKKFVIFSALWVILLLKPFISNSQNIKFYDPKMTKEFSGTVPASEIHDELLVIFEMPMQEIRKYDYLQIGFKFGDNGELYADTIDYNRNYRFDENKYKFYLYKSIFDTVFARARRKHIDNVQLQIGLVGRYKVGTKRVYSYRGKMDVYEYVTNEAYRDWYDNPTADVDVFGPPNEVQNAKLVITNLYTNVPFKFGGVRGVLKNLDHLEISDLCLYEDTLNLEKYYDYYHNIDKRDYIIFKDGKMITVLGKSRTSSSIDEVKKDIIAELGRFALNRNFKFKYEFFPPGELYIPWDHPRYVAPSFDIKEKIKRKTFYSEERNHFGDPIMKPYYKEGLWKEEKIGNITFYHLHLDTVCVVKDFKYDKSKKKYVRELGECGVMDIFVAQGKKYVYVFHIRYNLPRPSAGPGVYNEENPSLKPVDYKKQIQLVYDFLSEITELR